MTHRKLASVSVIVVVLISTLLGLQTMPTGAMNGSFGGGDGTLDNPYLIEDVWDLQNMSGDLAAYYALSNDIDASATATWNAGAGFVPVGRRNQDFTGSLDGRNHTITDLYIYRESTEYVGLFGSIGASGWVRDLGIAQGDVYGKSFVGGLAGASRGAVDGVHYTGKVSGTGSYVGGLMGFNNGGYVNESHTAGLVSGGGDEMGGLVGFNTGPVADCHSTSDVTGATQVGGLVGEDRGSTSNCYAAGRVVGTVDYVGGLAGTTWADMANCYATGAVAGGKYVGGLAGINSGTISNSYAIGNVIGNVDWVAGLVGRNDGTVKYSYSLGNITGPGGVSGLIGWSNGGKAVSSHYDIDRVHINGGHHVTYCGLYDAQYQDWYSSGMSLRISDYAATIDPSGDHYDLSALQGLRDLLGFTDGPVYDFHLASDIDLSAAPGLYIPYLEGEFDGENHTVYNLSLDMPFANYLGLVGIAAGGALRNVSLLRSEVRGHDFIGGLAGVSYGGLTGAHSIGNVSGRDYVGGLVGYGSSAYHSDVYAVGNVTGANSTGGLVGSLGGKLSRSYSTAIVTGKKNVGGLAGWNYAELDDCYSTGFVVGVENVGGLAGDNWGKVNDSYSLADVRGTGSVGGLVGMSYGSSMSRCFAAGDVTGDNTVGGLVGYLDYLGKVRDCYATGAASGSYTVGGLVGKVNTLGAVDDSYSTGAVTASGTAGGLVATSGGTVSNCFWDTETSGRSTSAGGTGKTTTEMRTRSTFTDAGWDFASVWFILESVTYPLLRWQDSEPPVADAGPDQTVVEGTLVGFDGSGSSDDYGLADLTWTLQDGGPVTLHGVTPEHLFDNPGVFVVTLNVTDYAGAWDTDTMTVTVRDVTPPVADAGPDQVVGQGDVVAFDGSASSDNVGIVNYTWSFVDGVPVKLIGSQPTHRFDVAGIYVVTLNVTDGTGLWGTDVMTVTVVDTTAPVAEAGPDQEVDEGTLVSLDGTGSSDNVGIANYTWTITDANAVVLYGAHVSYTFVRPGIYLLTLNVTDAAGNWATDTLKVTVRDITPPVADPGPDRTIDQGTVVDLDGSASRDNVAIVSYAWTLDDGGLVTLLGVRHTHRFDSAGTFTVVLNVTDAAGLWDTATMNVTVRDVTPPVADAGPDQTVDDGTAVTLDGSGSRDNVGIVNYTWTVGQGSDRLELYGVKPTLSLRTPGVHPVVLRATDAAGNSGEDSMNLSVVDVTPPVANAGPDLTVPIWGSVAFDGSQSTDDGPIASYSWAFTYEGVARTLSGKGVTFPFAIGGVYEVVLTVTDVAGNTGTDTVVITVVDTGRVTGTVLDGDGRPVGGARVVVQAADGKAYNATTWANGSFALDVHHGPFSWRVSKDGYRAISGSDSVAPMNSTVLDLTDKPLVRESGGGASAPLITIVALVAILVVIGLVLLLLRRRKGGQQESPH